jgi:hypothetical protein
MITDTKNPLEKFVMIERLSREVLEWNILANNANHTALDAVDSAEKAKSSWRAARKKLLDYVEENFLKPADDDSGR